MKKLIIILLSGILLFPILGVADNKEAKYKLTEQEQETLKQYQGETITVGYLPGYTKVLAEHVMELMQSELDLDVELVEYDELNLLYKAVESGEVDIASGLKEGLNYEDLYYSKSIHRDFRILVTTIDSSIQSIENLAYSTVGFLTNDNNYTLTENELVKNHIEYIFYDSMDEAKQALYSGEIQGFISNSSMKDYVMTDPNLISRVALQDNPTALRMATGQEEYESLIDICGNVIGDLTDTVRGEALDKKIIAYESELIDDYISENYSNLSNFPDEITINTLRTSFPYSYIDEDGKYTGSYIDMMDFFAEKTGIEYTIANQEESVQSYNEMLERVNSNEVQFVLSPLEHTGYTNVDNLDSLDTDDPIVSIQDKEFSEGSYRSIDDVSLGMTEDLSVIGGEYLKNKISTYKTNAQAFKAFKNDEFDLLITHKSVLDYFQRIMGETDLIQNNYIVKDYQYSVLANKDNAELNDMLEDISRLYVSFRVGSTDHNSDIVASNFINYILEQQAGNHHTKILLISIIFIIVSVFGITLNFRRKREYQLLKYKHTIDELTGLTNRNSYKEKVNQLILKSSDTLGAFIFLDLNYFKEINDTHGHHIGDKVLIEFARGLQSFENDNVIAFRIAGDEFGIYASGFEVKTEIDRFINSVVTYPFNEIDSEGGKMLKLNFSVGYSISPLHTTDFAKLCEYADFAMYKAKKRKSKVNFNCPVEEFDKEVYDEQNAANLKMVEIDTVLNERDIYTLYQPIFNLENQTIYGYEGFSRTNNKNFSNILDVVQHAIKADRIEELDALMLGHTISHFEGEGKLFIKVEDRDVVVINRQITNALVELDKLDMEEDIILEVCERSDGGQVGFTSVHKLIENYILESIDLTKENATKIRNLMVMYPNIIKISRPMFENANRDYKKLEFLQVLITLGHKYKFDILCEGIETEEELKFMKLLGVRYAQGYYLGEPKQFE